MQSLQPKLGFTVSRDLQCFDQSGNARTVEMRDLRQINAHCIWMGGVQKGEKRSCTAGEESISIRPYKDANVPFSLVTIFIPDFSILSLLLLSTESGPFQHNV